MVVGAVVPHGRVIVAGGLCRPCCAGRVASADGAGLGAEVAVFFGFSFVGFQSCDSNASFDFIVKAENQVCTVAFKGYKKRVLRGGVRLLLVEIWQFNYFISRKAGEILNGFFW